MSAWIAVPRRIFCAAVLLGMLTGTAALSRAQSAPSTPAALDPQTLSLMYRNALADHSDASKVAHLDLAHELMEQYFTARSTPERQRIIDRLNALKIDPSILGRIVGIRSTWQRLTPGVYYINERAGPIQVKYFLGIPAGYDVTRSWSLVVKLPVSEPFLSNPPPDGQRVIDIYSQWIKAELTQHPDALVLMPLLNLDVIYGPSPVGIDMVMQPIINAAGKANIDPARVYMIGHSMAAHAVWNIALFEPTYFAAINPLEGSAKESWQRIRMGNLKNVLPVVWADASDDVVPAEDSSELVRYLRNMKYDVDYTQTQNLGHLPTPPILDEEYAKLRARTRQLYPAEVFLQSQSPETIFNREDWVQIYQPLDSGPTISLAFSHGPGMTLYTRTFRVIGTLGHDNTITLDTENVQVLRLYLNDQMVDFSKPVTVIANGKQRFSAIVPQSVEEMLKDQVFLGRGWRYYTGVIDLDLTEPASRSATSRSSSRPAIEYVAPDGEHKVFIPSGN